MKVTAISHAAVLRLNQWKFVELAQRPDVILSLVAPQVWKERHLGHCYRLDRSNAALFPIVGGRTTPNWKGMTYMYYTALYTHLRRFRPEVIEIDAEPYSLAAFQATLYGKRLGCKLVGLQWDNIFKHRRFPLNVIERFTLRHADAMQAGNRAAADVLQRKGYTRPIVVIGQGFDPRILDIPDSARDETRQRWGLDSFVIGYAGRLHPQKSVQTILEAAMQLEGDWQVLIVGDGPTRAELVKRATDLGLSTHPFSIPHSPFSILHSPFSILHSPSRVVFTGALPHEEVPRAMKGMDVLVLPSITTPGLVEQFGQVLVEAMVCGVPVIGSTSGEIPHVIGDAGLLFQEGEADDLAERLQRLMHDRALWQDLSARGRERALGKYTWRAVAEKTWCAYQAVYAGTREICPEMH